MYKMRNRTLKKEFSGKPISFTSHLTNHINLLRTRFEKHITFFERVYVCIIKYTISNSFVYDAINLITIYLAVNQHFTEKIFKLTLLHLHVPVLRVRRKETNRIWQNKISNHFQPFCRSLH